MVESSPVETWVGATRMVREYVADHLMPISETLVDRLIIERRVVEDCSTGCFPLSTASKEASL